MIIPPIKIQGKKTKLVPKIMEIANNLLDEHSDIDTWVEPFLGSGVVAFNCPTRIKKVIVNDINPHIIKFYKSIADGEITSQKIQEVFEEHNRRLINDGGLYYTEIKERFNQTFDTMDFLFLTRTGFNGVMRFNGSGKWNVPFCKINDRLSKTVIDDLKKTVDELSQLFLTKEFTFYNKSFEEVLEASPANSIFYCDPPYYGLQVQYFKGWGKEDEIKLNQMLKDKVFIYSTWLNDSHRDNPMINEYWGDYMIESKQHKYNVAEKSSERAQVQEGLIYPGVPNEYALF
jgi:DNA adenine methylase